ncbi:DEAD/DEAH box helicase [Leucobacter weissii]|uniref:DEAD/DEAH box helicase n=1 Tax=Leucobacter weissii TaxID=1983706 RepID=UPI003132FC6B
MARRRGYRPPGDYDPRRGPKRARPGGRASEQREAEGGSSRPAGPAPAPVPAQPPLRTPPAPLDAVLTRAEDVAGASFAELGVGGNIVRALAELGATKPLPIQVATIPDALAGHHVLGRGRTGSGKTIAFGAALVERLLRLRAEGAFPDESAREKPRRGERRERSERGGGRAPRALILAPTRELALQIDRTVQPIARSVGLYTGQFVGGQPLEPQLHALRRGVDIAIGTPGRVEDLAGRGHLDLGRIAVTVLDEADHMAELGFVESVRRILRRTRRGGQRLLFSATLDRGVDELVREFLPSPAIHEVVEGSRTVGPEGRSDAAGGVEHRVLIVLREHKDDALVRLVGDGGVADGAGRDGRRAGPVRTIVFCRTRAYAEHVVELLAGAGLRAVALHGDLSQPRRERNLESFAAGRARVLVATDVAARGIHVDGVELVLQADPPDDPKAYLHRAGRTGRVGGDGEVRGGTVLTVIPRTRQKRTRELFAELGIEPASFADFAP